MDRVGLLNLAAWGTVVVVWVVAAVAGAGRHEARVRGSTDPVAVAVAVPAMAAILVPGRTVLDARARVPRLVPGWRWPLVRRP